MNSVLIFDVGSGNCRAGSADGAMDVKFRSIIGQAMNRSTNDQVGTTDVRNPRFPIDSNGRVTNWDDMEKILYHAFEQTRLTPEECSTLMTQSASCTSADRVMAGQIMFETMNIPSLFLANRGVMALNATGRKSGIVVRSGYGGTDIVPVLNGKIIGNAIIVSDVSGKKVTAGMAKMLTQRTNPSPFSADEPTYDLIKRNYTYVALNYSNEIATSILDKYPLPNEMTIILGVERFKVPEGLFQPSLFGMSGNGIHRDLHSSIVKCDPVTQRVLCENVVLAGGNTMFPGLVPRLESELNNLMNGSMKARVTIPNDPHDSSWNGAAAFANDSNMDNLWITRETYDEGGASVLDNGM